MQTPATPLPPDVLAAIDRGNVIEAIKLLRESTGLGLAEAKAVVDSHMRGIPVPGTGSAAATALTLEEVVALQRGDKIEAVKLLRNRTGLGLKEAHDAVTAAQGNVPPSSELAPGEVRRSRSVAGWLVVLAIAGAFAYFWVRG